MFKSSTRNPLAAIIAAVSKGASGIFTALIFCYQSMISPFGIGWHCRFYPSCSAYAKEAVKKFGVLKGCWLTVKRLLRCHPWHPGGVDFVCTKDKAS